MFCFAKISRMAAITLWEAIMGTPGFWRFSIFPPGKWKVASCLEELHG
jgi:hypothetical protein